MAGLSAAFALNENEHHFEQDSLKAGGGVGGGGVACSASTYT